MPWGPFNPILALSHLEEYFPGLILRKEYAESKGGKINVFVQHSRDDIININEYDNEILNDFDTRLEHLERRAITNPDESESFLSLIC